MIKFEIFRSVRFGKIKAAVVNGEPVFGLSDVCRAIGRDRGDFPCERLSGYTEYFNTHAELKEHPVALDCVTLSTLQKIISESASEFYDYVLSEIVPKLQQKTLSRAVGACSTITWVGKYGENKMIRLDLCTSFRQDKDRIYFYFGSEHEYFRFGSKEEATTAFRQLQMALPHVYTVGRATKECCCP